MPVPVTARAMIPVAKLAAHPGNVRHDLDLSEDFIESIRANGVTVAVQITPDGDGYRVIDGARRLAGALKAGVEEVPYDLIAERAGDEAGQYLDMVTTNRYRNPLTTLEEADALFAAKEAGATRTRIRKAAGLTSAGLTSALAAAKLSEETRARVEDLDEQLTLDQLAVFAEFEDDATAIARLSVAADCGTLDHEAELLRQARTEQAEHDRICRDLETAGYTVTSILPANGQHLPVLCHDGEDLTEDTHAACPGRGVYFRFWDQLTPIHYCASPGLYGHAFRHDQHHHTAAGSPASPSAPGGYTPEPAEPDPGRQAVIQGNRAWKAAAEVRKRWLATHLFTRRTAPREVAQFVARQILTMPGPLRTGLARATSLDGFTEVTGRETTGWLDLCGTAPASRLPLVMLAPIAATYEQVMTDNEGRNTWRTDRYSPCPRTDAGHYFAFLASIGYQLSAIEQAVTDGTPYNGETPPGDPITRQHADPEEPAPGEPEAAGPEPETDAGTSETSGPEGVPADPGAGPGSEDDRETGTGEGEPVPGEPGDRAARPAGEQAAA